MRLFVLVTTFAVTLAINCTNQVRICPDIRIFVGCGWCWDTTATNGQVHGGRPGTSTGPTDGLGPCSDWTINANNCHTHVDCSALPDCLNILGTKCGWCEDTQKASDTQGNCKNWVYYAVQCPQLEAPQHVHLSYTNDPTVMAVTWASLKSETSMSIYWEAAGDPRSARQVPANTTHFVEGNPQGLQYIQRAMLTGLVQGTNYTYYVQTGSQKSANFSFQAMKPGTDWLLRALILGDMGRHGGGFALQSLEREVQAQEADFLIHVGDFAYDMHDDGGLNGDTFMTRIQPVAARVPYMTCIGNHEDAYSGSHYRNRFTMPRYDSRGGMDMWHSWDTQLVHFVSYSSEVYFAFQSDISTQLQWLEQDLKAANQRRGAVPWIIAYGHRPFYCSNADHDDCTTSRGVVRAGLESLFHKYGVDLVIEAHEHSYERLWPVYNETVTQKDYVEPKAMVHLITGFTGCNEADGACLNPILQPLGPWSAFRSSAEGMYSYLRLHVHNHTHLYAENYLVEAEEVQDSLWIVQHTHGMRT